MRVLHLEPDQIPASTRARLEGAAKVDYVGCDSQEALRGALAKQSYGAVFVRLGLSFGEEEFALCPDLVALVTPTTGLDHISLDAAESRGVAVLSLRGETELLEKISSTAEMTWALLLAVVRKLPFAFGSVLDGRWGRWDFEGEELIDKTLGIVGCGRLGRMVAKFGHAFGMTVLAHDSDPDAPKRAASFVEFVDLDALLERSDVVSLHLPLNAETQGYFGATCFAKMKAGSYFLNTARAELTDEDALLRALENRLAGAAVDVLRGDSRWDDGVPDLHPLVAYARSHDNLVISPHIGGCSKTATERTRDYVVGLFLSFLDGRQGA